MMTMVFATVEIFFAGERKHRFGSSYILEIRGDLLVDLAIKKSSAHDRFAIAFTLSS